MGSGSPDKDPVATNVGIITGVVSVAILWWIWKYGPGAT